MRVPREVLECVAFIYAKERGQKEPKPVGTVFFIKWPDKDSSSLEWSYAITARHVIDDIKAQSPDGTVYLRLNRRDGHGVRLIPTKPKHWLSHPTNASVDVAVLPFELPIKEYLINAFTMDSRTIPDGIPVGRESRFGLLSIGDEVFMAGLFTDRVGDGRNIPILRVGNIAALASEPIKTKRFGQVIAHLIEARSIGGLSGSPVFVNLGPHPPSKTGKGDDALKWAQDTDTLNSEVFILLGLIHGHWDKRDRFLQEVNMGIAMVVPTKHIFEVLRQDVLEKQRREEKEAQMTGKNEPTLDSSLLAGARK